MGIVFLFLGCTKQSDPQEAYEIKTATRSTLNVEINADVETFVINKLKNPNDASNLELQDEIFLIPDKFRYEFNSLFFQDGSLETEMIYKDPGGMTFPRNDVPESDLSEIKKVTVSNGTLKMFDVNGLLLMEGPLNYNFLNNYSLDLIDKIVNGFPDIMNYVQFIDNLPNGSSTQINSRFIEVNYFLSNGNQITEVFDLEIDRLVGYIVRDETSQLISRQLINYECSESDPLLKRIWTQRYNSTVNGFDTVEETTQIFHQFNITKF